MSSLKFGTSGLRGLVVDLDGPSAYGWTRSFLSHLERTGRNGSSRALIGRDLRSSSPSIARRVAAAIEDAGWTAIDCGALPTPALALAAAARSAAAVMVTGSHIPDDRNGLKFYSPEGEIDKADEAGIRRAHDDLAPSILEAERSEDLSRLENVAAEAVDAYVARAVEAFGPKALTGLRIGVYEQSSVARDVLGLLLASLGAETAGLGRADRFVPVDTEAHRPEDVEIIAAWAEEYGFDAIVSADGDGDRPLVADGAGSILRGDVLGMLVARNLNLRTIVTPVTSSSAIEKTGIADEVLRTKVGSPFVIEAMDEASRMGRDGIVGFEANGGVLLGSDIRTGVGELKALRTRDAALPILCALAEIVRQGRPLAAIVEDLKAGFAIADRLTSIETGRSAPFLKRLAHDPDFTAAFLAPIGRLAAVDEMDGVRMTLSEGGVIHYRASGNAPELRCYVEAQTMEEARQRLSWGLDAARRAIA